MLKHHQLDISVSGKGELDVKVHYRGQVPDLLSRFSDEVRRQAMRFVWWKTRYERRLLRAARLMPDWAKATIQQHILYERAVRIETKLARQAEARRLKEQQRSATIVARHAVKVPEPQTEQRSQSTHAKPGQVPSEHVKALPEATAPAKASPEVALAVPESEPPRQGWGSPMRELSDLTLTEMFAKATSALQATPQPERDRSRDR